MLIWKTDDEEASRAALFYWFVLAGCACIQHNLPRHVTLNALDNLPNVNKVAFTWDYDLLSGVLYKLPYTRYLELVPIPSFRQTLKTNNHMKLKAFIDVIVLIICVYIVCLLYIHSSKGSLDRIAHPPDIKFPLWKGCQSFGYPCLLTSDVQC